MGEETSQNRGKREDSSQKERERGREEKKQK